MTTGTHGAAARRSLGEYGELLAAQHLREQGMVLLDHNWRCAAGEIDLVLRDGAVVVFCEVKTRRSDRHGTALEAVTTTKAARMRRLAALWLAAHDLAVRDVRLDLVGITSPRGASPVIDHVRGVG